MCAREAHTRYLHYPLEIYTRERPRDIADPGERMVIGAAQSFLLSIQNVPPHDVFCYERTPWNSVFMRL